MEKLTKKTPIITAVGVVIAVTLWMLSGLGSEPGQDGAVTISGGTEGAGDLTRVRVENMQASEITRQILISGRTEPDRVVNVKAEAEGAVAQILAERGKVAEAGETILTLDMRDRESRLAEARALVKQRELEFKAAQNLRDQQFTSETQIAQAEAQLAVARAAMERIELEIAYTSIDAPFTGVIQERMVEIGDFVRVGDDVVELVDLDPIIVAGEVNERNVGHIALGRKGNARLTGGQLVQGTIRYISRVADPATRTFTVELSVPNPGHYIRAGLTTEMSLLADTLRVHTFSSALLSLADDGTVGVKVVNADNRVEFYPVEIVGSAPDGIQVTGLPDSVRMITVGQGFVTEGQQVEPVAMSVPESGP